MTKKLGILGLGNRTTQFYIQQLNQKINEKYGGYSTCPFILLNVNFNEINPYLPNDYKVLESVLENYLNKLITKEVNTILIPNITLHETFDRIKSKIEGNVEFIHPVQSTIQQLKLNGKSEAMIVGSGYTMNSPVMESAFSASGIKLFKPEKEEQLFMDNFRKLMYDGKETQKDIELFHDIIRKYSEKNAIVIACTELSIPLYMEDNVYDMARIQIKEAFDLLND